MRLGSTSPSSERYLLKICIRYDIDIGIGDAHGGDFESIHAIHRMFAFLEFEVTLGDLAVDEGSYL